jgi:hypothetical protein
MPASAAVSLDRDLPLFDGPGAPGTAGLHVNPRDITFHNPTRERVAVSVNVTNVVGDRSLPATAIMSAAPLGAFLPWRPLAVVPVPALPPGQATTLRLDAVRPAVRPLGPPDRVPPRRLLVALGAGDGQRASNPPQSTAEALLQFLRQAPGRPAGGTTEDLPADPLELLGRGAPHWAGNLNIFLGGRPVERHMAQALRVYPGRVNLAIFMVGAGGRDEYRFGLEGSGVDWDAALYDLTERSSFLLDREKEKPVEGGRWVEVVGTRVLALAICPPTDCATGSVEVHVRQRSTGQSAVVEFSLDPRADGPGCYTL